jgi:hypothetical protein
MGFNGKIEASFDHPPEASTMLAAQEKIERQATLQSALASQRMEGLEPDAQVVHDAEQWARGELPLSTAIANFKARVRHDMP